MEVKHIKKVTTRGVLAILMLLLFAGHASASGAVIASALSTCDWELVGDWTAELGFQTDVHDGPEFGGSNAHWWTVNTFDYWSHHYVYGSPTNDSLPAGGPPAEPLCPQWPDKVQVIRDDDYKHTWPGGSKYVDENEIWDLRSIYVQFSGGAAMRYIPYSEVYIRTVDVHLVQVQAYFCYVGEGSGESGDPG